MFFSTRCQYSFLFSVVPISKDNVKIWWSMTNHRLLTWLKVIGSMSGVHNWDVNLKYVLFTPFPDNGDESICCELL